MTAPKRNRLTKAAETRFAEMWAAGATHQQIADTLGLGGPASTGRIRDRLGLPLRQAGWKPVAVPVSSPEPAAAEPLPPAMPPHPFWTPVRDLAVLGTAGRYPALTALAAQMGKPVAALLQRWHQLRAA